MQVRQIIMRSPKLSFAVFANKKMKSALAVLALVLQVSLSE